MMKEKTKDSPSISIIIPMRNEEKYIERCLDSLLDQDYLPDKYEIIVIDGESTDDSSRIVKKKAQISNCIHLLKNPYRTTPHGFNIGIQHTKSDLITIFSAHAYAPSNFISKSVYHMQLTGANCVGGRVIYKGENDFARAVAKSMNSPFGMGNVHYRSSKTPSFVDTVTNCTYRKEVFDQIGLFDVTLLRNQDYELNYRLRKNGGKIYFTPDIKSFFYSRSKLSGLIKQYFQYGFWKVRTIKKFIKSIKLRHIVPPTFVATIAIFGIGALFSSIFLKILCLILASYLISTIIFTLSISLKKVLDFFLISLIFFTMHFFWGAGFIWGILSFPFYKKSPTLKYK